MKCQCQYLSRIMRKPTICICENKDADQLRSNCEADQRLCFRYTDNTIPLLSKSKIYGLQPSSVPVQPGLCWTCSETTLFVFPRGGSFYILSIRIAGLSVIIKRHLQSIISTPNVFIKVFLYSTHYLSTYFVFNGRH